MTWLLFTSVLWSVKNRVLSRIRRLKQARYLVGTVAAIAYYTLVFHPWNRGGAVQIWTGGGELPAEWSGALEAAGSMLLTLLAAVPWILPSRRGALNFTEAEIAFLFPAPLTRRQVVNYSLMKTQFGILFGVLIFTFFAARHVAQSFLHGFIVVWLLFTAMTLYSLGTGITIASLSEHGASALRRFWVPLAIGAAAIGSLVWGFASGRIPSPGSPGVEGPAEYLTLLGSTAPLSWIILPCRLLIHPLFARGALPFLVSLIPACLVILTAYTWVIRSDHRYEEASIERAARRAARLAARHSGTRSGRRIRLKASRPPFRLKPDASPGTAMFWRGLTAAWRLSAMKYFFLVLSVIAGASWIYAAFFSATAPPEAAAVSAVMPLIFAGVMVLLGPDMVRTDLRNDLLSIDVLKGFPAGGPQLIAMEVMPPAVLVTGVQILLLVIALPLVLVSAVDRGGGEILAAGAGALLLSFPLNLLSSLLHNAAILLFPGWHQLGLAQPRGMEAFGQLMVSMLLRLLAFTIVLLPAAAIAAAVLFFTWSRMGSASMPLAAVLAGIPAAVMAWVGIKILGLLFERFDPSKELEGII